MPSTPPPSRLKRAAGKPLARAAKYYAFFRRKRVIATTRSGGCQSRAARARAKQTALEKEAVQRKHIAPQSKTAQNANKNTPPRKKWL